jgi:hypothetical protein
LGDNHPFTFHSIVIRPSEPQCYFEQDDPNNEIYARYGNVYIELSNATGGIVGNICSDDYTGQLSEIKGRIDYTLDAISLECEPIEGSVVINGKAASSYSIVGDKLVFSPSLQEGERVTGSYQCFE